MAGKYLLAAGLGGFVAVAAGAAGTHALADDHARMLVDLASRYLLLHAAALLGLAHVGRAGTGGWLVETAFWLFLAGMLLFGGGLLVSAWAAASVLGGLAYLRRDWRSGLTRRLLLLFLANAAGFAALALAHAVWQLAILLCLGGVLMAPATSVEYELIGQLTPPGRATESFAWFASASYAAGGLGGVVAGLLVQPLGLDGAFLVPGGFALLAAVPAWRVHRLLNTAG